METRPNDVFVISEKASLNIKKARGEIRREIVKAQKEYICDYCGEKIGKREKHVKSSCIECNGGKKEIIRYREHPECWRAISEVTEKMPQTMLGRFVYPGGSTAQKRGKPCHRSQCVCNYVAGKDDVIAK